MRTLRLLPPQVRPQKAGRPSNKRYIIKKSNLNNLEMPLLSEEHNLVLSHTECNEWACSIRKVQLKLFLVQSVDFTLELKSSIYVSGHGFRGQVSGFESQLHHFLSL